MFLTIKPQCLLLLQSDAAKRNSDPIAKRIHKVKNCLPRPTVCQTPTAEGLDKTCLPTLSLLWDASQSGLVHLKKIIKQGSRKFLFKLKKLTLLSPPQLTGEENCRHHHGIDLQARNWVWNDLVWVNIDTTVAVPEFPLTSGTFCLQTGRLKSFRRSPTYSITWRPFWL